MYVEFKQGKKHGYDDAETSDSVDVFKDAGYILEKNDLVVDIDCLNKEQIKELIKRFNIKTQVVWTDRGAHLYFTKPQGFRGASAMIPLGFEVEYKHYRNTKATTIKRNGITRDIENKGKRENLPEFLKPNRKLEPMLGLQEGDGRNNKLFNYRVALAYIKNWQTVINFINDIIFAEPLPEKEMETILRDIKVEAVKDGESIIANTIMNDLKVVRFSKRLYFLDGEEYSDDSERLIRIIYQYCIGQKTKYIEEVKKQMEYRAPLIDSSKDFVIKFKNGILKNGKFYEVDYAEFTPYSIPIEYKQEAEPVADVDSYIKHLTNNDESYKNRLMEILGHSFIVNKEFKRLMGKFFIFVGDGGNGKGTLLTVIRSILNVKNCAGLSIKNMSDERYLNVLQGKLVNLGDDIQDEPINNEQMKILKNISTCDFVEIRKLYENSSSIELTPTLIFTSNHILKSFEKGESYKRRVDWLPMYGKPKKKEKDFISRLTTKEALEYWIKLIVDGYLRLYKNQAFTDCKIINQFNNEYHQENNNILEFMNNLNRDDILGKKSPEIYEEYETWANENGVNVQSRRLLVETIKDVFNLKIEPKKINGKTMRVFQEAT